MSKDAENFDRDLDKELENMFRRFKADLKSKGGKRAYNIKRIQGKAEIVGVYPVRATEPCHLVEMQISNFEKPFSFSDLTQSVQGKGRSFWQSPWLECLLNADGTEVLADANRISDNNKQMLQGNIRLAFFFHDLNFKQPLLTPFGEVEISKPTRRPVRLKMLKYETPD